MFVNFSVVPSDEALFQSGRVGQEAYRLMRCCPVHQRIPNNQPREPAEVPVSRPQLTNPVQLAERGNPRVMHLRAGHQAGSHDGTQPRQRPPMNLRDLNLEFFSAQVGCWLLPAAHNLPDTRF